MEYKEIENMEHDIIYVRTIPDYGVEILAKGTKKLGDPEQTKKFGIALDDLSDKITFRDALIAVANSLNDFHGQREKLGELNYPVKYV